MKRAFGNVFTSQNGVEYGVIRKFEGNSPTEISGAKVLAEDECGNYFLDMGGSILFWDHETNEHLLLANSLDDFIAGCATPLVVDLKSEQVESAWVDPEFAQKFGIEPKP
jgi:hypothetical protein